MRPYRPLPGLLLLALLGCSQGPPPDPEQVIAANLAKLGIEQDMAESQRYCAVRPRSRLGSMGVPVKLALKDGVVFLCCEKCLPEAEKDIDAAIKKADALHVQTALEQLDPADRKLAEAQRFCASDGTSPLGAMGKPIKIMVKGHPAFLCCAGCEKSVRQDEDKALELVKKLQAEGKK